MDNTLRFLIFVLYDDRLLRCALQVEPKTRPYSDDLIWSQETDWEDSANWPRLHALLPPHVRSCGPIVRVETDLFEVSVVSV